MAIIGAGRHDVKVIRSALAETGEEKTPQISVQFEDINGNTITAYLFLTDKAWPYTEEKLTTLGWEPIKRGYRFEELNLDPSPIVGSYVEIVNDEETYNGKTRVKVKYINPTGGRIERMEPAQAMAFADKLRQRILKGAPAPAPAAKQERFGTEVRPPPDDDIPF
jgi:hypothetical protein